jgi:hypothetical protein
MKRVAKNSIAIVSVINEAFLDDFLLELFFLQL